jgi:hypothetical protein
MSPWTSPSDGEPFTALNLQRMRDRLVPRPDDAQLARLLDLDGRRTVGPKGPGRRSKK